MSSVIFTDSNFSKEHYYEETLTYLYIAIGTFINIIINQMQIVLFVICERGK